MKAEKPRILYFVPERPASSDGVLHSTILAEAGYLHRNGFDCLFIGADVSYEKANEAESYIKKTYGVSAKVFGGYSLRFGAVGLFLLARKVARLSKDVISRYRPTHVCTYLYTISGIGRKIAREQRAVSVFKVRGMSAEEVALKSGNGIKCRLCRWMETNALRKSDRLSGVSYKLKQWVETLTGRDDLVVVPCCFDAERFCFDKEARKRIRKEYGFWADEKVICYSGGLSKWQRVPDIFEVCGQVLKIRDNFKFLFLSQGAERLRHMVEENNLPNEHYLIRSCTHQEIPLYLSAADAGIILRDDIPVNNVASPIKIGEYLGCGLPVILTKGIGDYSEMIAKAGVGVVLDENGDVAQQVVSFMEQLNFDELRGKAMAFAKESISWEAHLNNLKRLYSVEQITIYHTEKQNN